MALKEDQYKIIVTALDKTQETFRRIEGSFNSLTNKVMNINNLFKGILLSAPFLTLANAIKKAVDTGDELLKTSHQIGVSVEHLSGLKYAAELSETSLEALTVGIGILSKGIAGISEETPEATKTLKLLGINSKDANGNLRKTYDILLDVADSFRGMEDGAGKTAVAMNLFGRSGKELIPLLNEGSNGLRRMHEEAERLGIVFSKEAAEGAADFNDNITKLKANLNGLFQTIANDVIPSLNELFQVFEKGGPEKLLLKNINREIAQIKKDLAGESNMAKLFSWLPGWDDASQRRLAELEKRRAEILKVLGPPEEPPVRKPAPFMPAKPEKEGKEAIDWAWELGKLRAHQLEEEAKLIEKLKKEEQDRWEAQIKESVEYDEYMRRSAEEQIRTAREIQDLEISHQLAVIDLKEQSFELSKEEATEQRLTIFEKQLDNLQQQYEETVGIADKDLERLQILEKIDEVNGKVLASLQLQKELSGTFTEGLIEGINRYLRDAQTAFQGGLQVIQDVTSGMKSAFQSFFDYTSEKFMNFRELILKIINDIYRSIMKNKIIGPLVEGIMGGLGSLFGNTIPGSGLTPEWAITAHKGGYIIPRFHPGGLASDEVMAILQKGEYVVSRKGVQALDRINQGEVGHQSKEPTIIINVTNKGFPVKVKQTSSRFDFKKAIKTVTLELIATDPDYKNSLSWGMRG